VTDSPKTSLGGRPQGPALTQHRYKRYAAPIGAVSLAHRMGEGGASRVRVLVWELFLQRFRSCGASQTPEAARLRLQKRTKRTKGRQLRVFVTLASFCEKASRQMPEAAIQHRRCDISVEPQRKRIRAPLGATSSGRTTGICRPDGAWEFLR
jgi:hypothetical protein